MIKYIVTVLLRPLLSSVLYNFCIRLSAHFKKKLSTASSGYKSTLPNVWLLFLMIFYTVFPKEKGYWDHYELTSLVNSLFSFPPLLPSSLSFSPSYTSPPLCYYLSLYLSLLPLYSTPLLLVLNLSNIYSVSLTLSHTSALPLIPLILL